MELVNDQTNQGIRLRLIVYKIVLKENGFHDIMLDNNYEGTFIP